ncbi:MAG: hypothetical protein JWP06_1042 [Candidatus Saccharibacteria bacterium]|nr:hypothetical protein [Candidatus Saccharibacteria bacterium]
MYEQNNVEFMGVLVDRQYTTGQKYAQLVFETAEGIRLSLSRNINMVRSLRLGLTYKVKGPEHTVGQKRYVHEPTATLVSGGKLSLISKHYKILIPVAIGVIVVLSGVGALAYATHSTSTSTSSLPAVHKEKPISKVAPVTTSSQPASNTASTLSTSTQQQTKTTPVKSTKNSAPISTTTTAPVISDTTVAPSVTNDPASLTTQDGASGTIQPVVETPPSDAPVQTDPNPPVAP